MGLSKRQFDALLICVCIHMVCCSCCFCWFTHAMCVSLLPFELPSAPVAKRLIQALRVVEPMDSTIACRACSDPCKLIISHL